MKANALIVTLTLGVLAALPAHGFGYWNSATYASRFRPAPPAASQAKSPFQIGVVALQTPGTKADTKVPGATAAHPWGQPKPYATHSH
jgi:hypothetical protein